MVWFGRVLWHINHCRLFYAKSILFIYIVVTHSKSAQDRLVWDVLGVLTSFGSSNIILALPSDPTETIIPPGEPVVKSSPRMQNSTLYFNCIYKGEHKVLSFLGGRFGAVMPYLYFLRGPSKPHSLTHSSVQYISNHPSPSTMQPPKYQNRSVKKRPT